MYTLSIYGHRVLAPACEALCVYSKISVGVVVLSKYVVGVGLHNVLIVRRRGGDGRGQASVNTYQDLGSAEVGA